MTLVSEVLANLKDYGNEVAPMSDPDAPVEELNAAMSFYVNGGTAPE
jgi:hypothetical protein